MKSADTQKISTELAEIMKKYNLPGIVIAVNGDQFSYNYNGIGAGHAVDILETTKQDIIKRNFQKKSEEWTETTEIHK